MCTVNMLSPFFRLVGCPQARGATLILGESQYAGCFLRDQAMPGACRVYAIPEKMSLGRCTDRGRENVDTGIGHIQFGIVDRRKRYQF